MSKGKIIKTVLVTATVCSALWQAATFMEVLGSAKGGQPSLPGLIPSAGAPGLSVLPPGIADAMNKNQSVLNQLMPGAPATPPAPKEMVIFSAQGKQLSAAEQEALRREAERHRPKVPAPPAPPAAKRQR